MTTSLLTPDHIIHALISVYESFFNHEKNIEIILKEEQDSIEKISAFFQISPQTAIITAILWCNQIRGSRFQLNRNMKKLKMNTIAILECNEALSDFKKKGWLIPSKKSYEIQSTDDYLFSKEFMYAVSVNNFQDLEIKIAEDFFSAMIQLHRYIKNIISSLEFHSSEEIILEYIEKMKHIEPITLLFENPKIQPMERVLLAYLMSSYVSGEGSFDLNYCLDYIDPDGVFHYKFKDRVIKNQSVLFTEDYLSFYTDGFVDFSEVKLGSKIKDVIQERLVTEKKESFRPRILSITNTESLNPVKLFFNESLKTDLEKIFEITSNRFVSLTEKMKSQNLNSALTFIFHGNPGTGKTEVVKQIALKNNRPILSVDCSKILDKHVGESEKKMKQLFSEYRQAMKLQDQTPILLFNEADALLSKRGSVEKSVDQMYNSLQNILLQELEDFEGIFIATTNMLMNMDLAFDRRFLFKVYFEEPNHEVRLQILQNAFPNIDCIDTLLMINNKYSLNGGQIHAIKKRVFIENEILEQDTFLLEQLERLAQEQVNFSNIKHLKVGF
jgi:hypothetical protein